jgi:hypothetical protein
MPSERVAFDCGARLFVGNLAMPVHASRDHQFLFLGLDGIEWLVIFGTVLILGVIVTLSHLIDRPANVVNPPSGNSTEFI